MQNGSSTKEDSRIKDSWDEKFNDTSSQLSSAESDIAVPNTYEEPAKPAPNEDAEHAKLRDKNRNQSNVKADEERGGANKNDPTAVNHTSNVTAGSPITTNQFAKMLIRRGGPAAALGLVLLFGGMFLGTAIPGSLLLNLKENLTLNWDQQNITSEVRSKSILAKRLGPKATSSACEALKIELACRYSKPSNKLLTRLDEGGIKALRADGTIIEKQKFLAGERPKYYSYGGTLDDAALKKAVASGDLAGAKLVDAVNFSKALDENPVFRTAFRRAYNTRWVNWFDDAATKFLAKIGLSKKVNKKIAGAASEKAIEEAVQELADNEHKKLGKTAAAAEETMQKIVDTESKQFAKNASRSMRGKNSALMAASGLCIAARVPGFFSSVIRKFRLAQMAAVVFPVILVVADAIKAKDATPEMVNNSATMLTQTYTKPDNTKVLPAMDSGAIKYGIMKDVGSAVQSKTVKKYVPGYTGNSAFDAVAQAGQSPQLKTVCNAINSPEAAVATDAMMILKASNPVGWIMAAVDVAIAVDSKTTHVLETVLGSIIEKAVAGLSGLIDWQGILKLLMGDFASKAKGEEFGDMVGVLASTMADKANTAGNLPLTPDQALAYNTEVVEPTKLAWAQEDRLTYSPFDMSNPNTVMGTMATQFMYYYPQGLSLASSLSSTMNMFGSVLRNTVSPRASAATAKWTGLCTPEKDFAIASSGVAAGPLCDVQYGIPVNYLGADPDNVLTYLFKEKQIDSKGEMVKDSDLEAWVQMCNAANSYALSECKVTEQKQAYYGLYMIDRQNAYAMDGEAPPNPEGAAAGTTPAPGVGGGTAGAGGGSVSLVDPSKWAVSSSHSGAIDKGGSDWQKWVAAMGGNGNSSTGVLQPIPNSSSNICSQDNSLNQNGGGNLFNPNAAASVRALIDAYNKANPGKYLVPGACFRSIAGQELAYGRSGGKRINGGQWDCQVTGRNTTGGAAACPGSSNHGWGLAIDFRTSGSAGGMGDSITSFTSSDYSWMKNNSYQFGWINPVAMTPAGGCGSGQKCEAWHFQYVGPLYGG